MRLKITFSCAEGSTIPYNYNYQLYSAIAQIVQSDSSQALEGCNNYNLYTFSQLFFKQYRPAEQGIENMGQQVNWFISSPKSDVLEKLLKGLPGLGGIKVGEAVLDIADITVLADPELDASMEFSCMSPITMAYSSPSHRYGRLGDTDFCERLRQDLIQKYYKVHDSLPSDDKLQFTFNQRYIKNRRRVSRLVDFNGEKILGYMLPFKVEGNIELVRIGYQLGFGNCNHCGFGMVKIWYSNDHSNSEQRV